MSLQDWADNGWLRAHKTSRREIRDLLAIVRRDLTDARSGQISADWRFGIAYNAVLKLCTILLYAEGYRPTQNLAHYRTLQAMSLILGKDRTDDADYLDTCRTKLLRSATDDLASSLSGQPAPCREESEHEASGKKRLKTGKSQVKEEGNKVLTVATTL